MNLVAFYSKCEYGYDSIESFLNFVDNNEAALSVIPIRMKYENHI